MASLTKKEPVQEVSFRFFIRNFKEVEDSANGRFEYSKLYVTIKDVKTDHEISYQHLSPETLNIRSILRNIEKLYAISLQRDNQKLVEGAKEEILKKIALLLWVVEQ
jgi:hypothetical protein